jgi:hypothetical protein
MKKFLTVDSRTPLADTFTLSIGKAIPTPKIHESRMIFPECKLVHLPQRSEASPVAADRDDLL